VCPVYFFGLNYPLETVFKSIFMLCGTTIMS
jgi:hypothetical protein